MKLRQELVTEFQTINWPFGQKQAIDLPLADYFFLPKKKKEEIE
jgi:hypothetical protein